MGTARVEISQVGAVEVVKGLAGLLKFLALGVDVVCDDLLDKGLGVTVRVGGAGRTGLGDGNHVLEAGGVAVHGGRGGENDVGNVVLRHGSEKGNSAADIDAVVLERDFARLADGLSRYGQQASCAQLVHHPGEHTLSAAK